MEWDPRVSFGFASLACAPGDDEVDMFMPIVNVGALCKPSIADVDDWLRHRSFAILGPERSEEI